MNRFFRPLVASGLAMLLLGLLAVVLLVPVDAAARPATCESAPVIRVPDDCATIQEAIDVAPDQGQIYIRETTDAASTYRENLVIDKTLILWGGWDENYSDSPGLSTLDAQRLGRGVTISGAEELMVVIRGMRVVSGTADGLGGLTESAAFEINEGYTGTTALADATAPFVGQPGDDCGGGIYARNAHLRLYAVQVQDNIASASGRGFGGGVCAVDVPYKDASQLPQPFTPGLRIEEGSEITDNIASMTAEGAGGGLFASHAQGRITFADVKVQGNQASLTASGYGGGVFGVMVNSYFMGQSEVAENVASRSTDPAHFGRGGGAAVVRVTDSTVSGNHFTDNIAATATRGYGGGLYVKQTGNGFELRGTEYAGNRASAAANAVGYGGGLLLEDVSNNQSNFLRVNTFRNNVAATSGQGGGGGAFVTGAPEMKVLLNKFIGNRAVETAGTGASFGGGLALVNTSHPLIENNQFEGNTAAAGGVAGAAIHRGGGIFLSHTDELLFGENRVFTNTAAVALPGEGGGVYLEESVSSDERLLRLLDNVVQGNQASQGGGMLIRNAGEALVRHSRFVGNVASGPQPVGANAGGGLLIEQTAGTDMVITVDRNHFLRNQVSNHGQRGGGAALLGVGQFTLENNVFAGNQGAAAASLYLAAHPTAQETAEAANNTFDAAIGGPAIGLAGWNNPPFTFYNTIIAAAPVGVQVPAGSAVTMNYTLWHETPTRGAGGGVFSDQNPVAGDPVFVNVANDDYHVRKTSAARDAGDPAGIPPGSEVDLASAARPFGERVDIGAYEWRNAIHWPNDYTLLQDAIDVALPGDGDTILAVGQGYGASEEQIRITKSITLSGGWDPEFQGRNPKGPTFFLNQPQVPGRFVTIEGGPDVVVKIEGFSFSNGDASGLGGLSTGRAAAWSTGQRSVSLTAAPAGQDAGPQASPAQSPAALRTAAAQLAADGLLSDQAASALETLFTRLEDAAQVTASASVAPQDDIDCGGAILSSGAGFHLSESYFERNFASKSGDGFGGAVCVLDAPAGQLTLRDVEMRYNLGSTRGNSQGGALFINNSPEAELSGLNIYLNIASAQGPEGAGGGLSVVECDDLSLSNSVFDGNIAGGLWGNTNGSGGGAEIWQSAGVQVTDNVFRGNLGGSMCLSCRGGGLNLGKMTDAQVSGNQFEHNIAGIMEWINASNGGGLALDRVDNSQVLSNTFTSNAAGMSGANGNTGGGIYGIALSQVLFSGNTLTGNAATQVGAGQGGGAYLEPAVNAPSEHLTFRGNHFLANAASLSGVGTRMSGGGGMELYMTTDSAVQGNTFQSNRVGQTASGPGGGLWMRVEAGELGGEVEAIRVLVDGNTFRDNRADFQESVGGGLAASGVKEYTVTNNVFDGNRAAYGGALSMDINDGLTGAFSAAVVNNTLYNNTESAIFLYGENRSPFTITNTVIVSHTVGVSVPGDETQVTLAYTLWNDVEERTDNPEMVQDTYPITGPVRFVNAAAGNFRLQIDSAARDAGDPAGVPPAPDHDLDGKARPFGAGVDVGAFEWHGTLLYFPVIGRNDCSWPACVGWAIGMDAEGNAAIVHTADGGQSWTAQGIPAMLIGYEANDVSAVDTQTAWVALGGSCSGAILHTTDGGATWINQPVPSGLAGGIKSIKGVSRSEAWAASLGGVVLHTTNGGATWMVTPHPSVPISQVNRMDVNGSHIWIADVGTDGAGGAVVHSPDGGATWRRELLTNDGEPDSPLTVHAASADIAWASGTESLTFYRTLDGGAQWAKAATVGGFDHLDDICASSAEDAWGVTNGGGVDGRIKRVVAPVSGQAQSFDVTPAALHGYMPGGVTCLNSSVAWVVGQQGPNPDPAKPSGVILRTLDGQHWLQSAAPADIHFWKISMAGARR